MSTNTQNLPATIPAELRNQLPIFQVLGDKLPAAVKTPEAKKTISAAFFWIIVIGGAVAFVKYLPLLLEYAQKAVLLTVFSILLIVLLLLAPKIISFLHRLGTTVLFKGEKSIIRNNPIESLQQTLGEKRTQIDALDAAYEPKLRELDEKISAGKATIDAMIREMQQLIVIARNEL